MFEENSENSDQRVHTPSVGYQTDYCTFYLLQTLPQQNVFAYLPLRSYGFRFIIQGDFEVPSSREDVDSDKSWNQWLREEIPQLFIDALSVFMVSKVVSFILFLLSGNYILFKCRIQIIRHVYLPVFLTIQLAFSLCFSLTMLVCYRSYM